MSRVRVMIIGRGVLSSGGVGYDAFVVMLLFGTSVVTPVTE